MADEPNPPATGDPKETPPPAPPADQLGDGGKKALDEERRARRDAETRLKELEPLAKRAQELEDAQKTETQKLADANRSLEERAKTAELEACRMRVALRKGLTEGQMKRLFGTTEEELAADADELLEEFKGAQPETPPAGGRPKERLRPGAVPDAEPEETDPAKLAAAIPRAR
jgi:hypothetical protein